jgi:hypothetical protein
MYTKDIEVRGAPRHIEIDDTAGQEAYADIRNEKLGEGDVRAGAEAGAVVVAAGGWRGGCGRL